MGIRNLFTNYRGHFALFGAFLMHLTLGTIYTYANMSTYLVSYIHYYDPSIEFKNASWIFTANLIGMASVMALGGYVELKLGTRLTAFIGGALMSVGTFVSAFFCKSFIPTLIFYGLFPGIGSGISYGVDCSVAVRWFPNHAGLVNGIVLAGYGLGALVFNPVMTLLVNPENHKLPSGESYYDIADLQHLKTCIIILGITYFVIQVIAVLLMDNPPSFQIKDQSSNKILGGVEPIVALKTRQFYLIWLTVAINCFCVTILSSFWKELALMQVTQNDFLLALVGSITSLLNASGRIFFGWVNDKLKFKSTIIILYGSLTILCSFFAFITDTTLFSFTVSIIYFFCGGNYAQFPTVVSYSFGPKRLHINYGMAQTGNIITSILASVLSIVLMDTVGLKGIFLIISVVLLVTLIILMLFFENIQWQDLAEKDKEMAEVEGLIMTNLLDKYNEIDK